MITLSDAERRGRGRRPSVSEKRKDEVVLAYKAGLPVSMIVQKYGISRSSVYRILHERTDVKCQK